MNASGQDTYDLAHFTLADMVRCGVALRLMASQSGSMEEAAQKVTRYLFGHLWNPDLSQPCCVLVRLFKTHPFSSLSADIKQFANSMAGGGRLSGETRCLTLLGTAGEASAWNSRRDSKGHQAIPLLSEAIVAQSPMIAELIRSLGMSAAEFLRIGSDVIKELEQRKFGVFHVPAALGSPFIPAQKDFVLPYSVASALGCGGVLPDGELLVLIIFARTEIPASTAEMFRTIALNLKLGFLALLDKPVFSA